MSRIQQDTVIDEEEEVWYVALDGTLAIPAIPLRVLTLDPAARSAWKSSTFKIGTLDLARAATRYEPPRLLTDYPALPPPDTASSWCGKLISVL